MRRSPEEAQTGGSEAVGMGLRGPSARRGLEMGSGGHLGAGGDYFGEGGGVLQAFESRNWGVLGQGWGIWGSRRENEGKSVVFWGSWGVFRGMEGAFGGKGLGGRSGIFRGGS